MECEEMSLFGADRYLCFRVDIDARKPLRMGINVKGEGKQIWVYFKFLKLPDFCYGCRELGLVLKAYEETDLDSPKIALLYGALLSRSLLKFVRRNSKSKLQEETKLFVAFRSNKKNYNVRQHLVFDEKIRPSLDGGSNVVGDMVGHDSNIVVDEDKVVAANSGKKKFRVVEAYTKDDRLMSSTSSTSLVSITNFDNGVTNNINKNTTVCDTFKPPSSPPLGRSRGDHSCHLTKKAGSTYAEATKCGMGYSPNFAYNSTELRVISALPSFESLVISYQGRSMKVPLSYEGLHESILKPLTQLEIIIVEPTLPTIEKDLSNSHSPLQTHATDITLEPSSANMILPHPTHNQEGPANSDPLNTMDEDMVADSNDNDYEDSQALVLDEEEMVDTFLNLDPLQDLEMSTKSSKRRRVEEGDEGVAASLERFNGYSGHKDLSSQLNTQHIIWNMGFTDYDFALPVNYSRGIWVLWDNNHFHASVLIKDNRGIHRIIHDPTLAKNFLISVVYALLKLDC
ncbi:hypothetical protein Cgig2_002983 [Carnegiea gigantea]|uniref:Uncharacterized protein n=1 Tax=Carnegiea gigantea TaxID=171969 RepID=A0A9Q1K6D8_9CARY|nr:hypothetical protein Cgig2_002983 [Carnegiea gigantea]